MKKCVAIVGRPNVGKSTLYNRLLGERRAIVADTPGVTRDRLFADLVVHGRECLLVDTGGLSFSSGDDLIRDIVRQTKAAVAEADIVVFLLDGQTGLLAEDAELATFLRRSGKPIIWVVNKCESPRVRAGGVDFYALGMEEILFVSAEHGEGLGALRDALVKYLPPESEALADSQAATDGLIRVSVLGKPNVGKSSLVNSLIGSERLTTSERPGTTVDAVQIFCSHDGRDFLLFDTAGLRRRARVSDEVETLGNVASLRALDFAHIVLLMIDAEKGITDQDLQLSALARDKGKAVIFLFNKLDLCAEPRHRLAELKQELEERLIGIRKPQILGISVKEGRGIKKIFPQIIRLDEVYRRRIGTGELNRWLKETTERHQHPLINRRPLKFYYLTQVRGAPPTFVFFVNRIQGLHKAYLRYLENHLLDDFAFFGVPLRIYFRKRSTRSRR